MKVFTVGLDQKPPIKDDSVIPEKSEKSDTPPPGYSTVTTTHIPLPMGPEIPQVLPPFVMRKSRGYKGIVMVILTVFLIAVFALMLSEIAYNRQRDESYLRLRWAELKHRLGYGNFEYFDRINSAFNFNKQKEIIPETRNFVALNNEESTPTTSTPAPILAETIDTSESRNQVRTNKFTTSFMGNGNSQTSRSSSNENGGSSTDQLSIDKIRRDFSLGILRHILDRIRQNAADMGFDSTMQVSIIDVEPQVEESSNSNQKSELVNNAVPHSQFFPNFFTHPRSLQNTGTEEPLNVKSNAFLDGFGEVHQPSFAQNNMIVEQNQARHPNNNPESLNSNHDIKGIQWSRVNKPFTSESSFRPLTWHLMAPQQSQSLFYFPMSHQPHPSFHGNSIIDNTADDLPPPQHQNQPPLSITNDPLFVFPQQQHQTVFSPMSNFGPGQSQPPQSEPLEFGNAHPNLFPFQPDLPQQQQLISQPNQETMGMNYGRDIGKFITQLINNNQKRIMNFLMPPTLSQLQQQQQRISSISSSMQLFPLPKIQNNIENVLTISQLNNGYSQTGINKPPISFQWYMPPQPQFPINNLQNEQFYPFGINQRVFQQNQLFEENPELLTQQQQQQQQKLNFTNLQQKQMALIPPLPPVIYFPPEQPIQEQQQQQQQQQQILEQFKQIDIPLIIKSNILSEDRIQVEPSTTVQTPAPAAQQQQQQQQQQQETVSKTINIVDNNVGWTHQPQHRFIQAIEPNTDTKTNDDDAFESYHNFQKMMAAGSEAAARIGLFHPSLLESTNKNIERPTLVVDSSSGNNIENEKDEFNNKNQWMPLQVQSLNTKSQKNLGADLFNQVETPPLFQTFHSAAVNNAPVMSHRMFSTSSIVQIPIELITKKNYTLAKPKPQLSLAKQMYSSKYTKPLSASKLAFANKPFPIDEISTNSQSVEPFDATQSFKTVTQFTPIKNEIQYSISTKPSASNLIIDLFDYNFKNEQIIKPTYMPDFPITKPYKNNNKQKSKIDFQNLTNPPEIVVRPSLITDEKPPTALDYKKFVFKQPNLSTFTNYGLNNIKLPNNNSLSIMIDNDPFVDMFLQTSTTESVASLKQVINNNSKESDFFKTPLSFINSNMVQGIEDKNNIIESDSHDQISSWVNLNLADNIQSILPNKDNNTPIKKHLELEKNQLENESKKIDQNTFFIDEILNKNLNQTLKSLTESLSSILTWSTVETPTTNITINSTLNKNFSDIFNEKIKQINDIFVSNLSHDNNITQIDDLIIGDITDSNSIDQFTLSTTINAQSNVNNQEINKNNNNNNNNQQNDIQKDLIQESTTKKNAVMKKIIINNISSTVDFPAVKFSSNNNNNNNNNNINNKNIENKENSDENSQKIISNNDDSQQSLKQNKNNGNTPNLVISQNDQDQQLPASQTIQQSPPIIQSNSVFFQVDDPSSIEQRPTAKSGPTFI